MAGGVRARLTAGKKLFLGALAIGAVAGPLAIGLAHPPKIAGQTATPLKFDVASVKSERRRISSGRDRGGLPGASDGPLKGFICWPTRTAWNGGEFRAPQEFGGAIYGSKPQPILTPPTPRCA